MAKHEITRQFSNKCSRNEVRLRVVEAFSFEEPGTGKGNDASKYIYYVETLSDGNRVYLQRPANLHNGFDFLVCVENANYAKASERRRNYPKHDDISDDLMLKKNESPTEYNRLFTLIQRVYACDDVSDSEMASVSFTTGLPVDHILKVIKWLFIEQDVRYWNYSGRNMTWNIIPQP